MSEHNRRAEEARNHVRRAIEYLDGLVPRLQSYVNFGAMPAGTQELIDTLSDTTRGFEQSLQKAPQNAEQSDEQDSPTTE